MPPSLHPKTARRLASTLCLLAVLPGCTAIGSALSPYPEKFSCKNSDHGQCIHPEQAYADAQAGRPSRSDPALTNDKKMLDGGQHAGPSRSRARRGASPQETPYLGYRDSVYRELKGLIDAPVTPMLRPGRSVRTLILPYADRERPDRLYMPRYVYSMVDTPRWVVADYLVTPLDPGARVPVLEQSKDPVDRSDAGVAPVDQAVRP
ncbi:TraV family lipoprotein [Sphingobium sp. AN558]|uniref:TraV family lipoprotein n=1 Tax=Sphingobium sp. AN558 TaxID=3133442 RepID=UPI0030C03385